MPVLPKHRHQAAAAQFAKWKPSSQAALESFRHTGHNEVSLLSLSTSDYPYFEPLVRRMKEVFGPLGVSIAFPSLRVNEALKVVASLIGTERHSGMTLAPEVARDDMREQIRKKISNQDLFDGCREAFQNGIDKVKLYFMCGLPGEREVDLDGIVDMAETIARDWQRSARQVCEGDRQRIELRAQAAHAVSVERHAAARVFSLGPSISEAPRENSQRAGEVPSRRNQLAGRRAEPRRPPNGRRRGTGLAARSTAG